MYASTNNPEEKLHRHPECLCLGLSYYEICHEIFENNFLIFCFPLQEGQSFSDYHLAELYIQILTTITLGKNVLKSSVNLVVTFQNHILVQYSCSEISIHSTIDSGSVKQNIVSSRCVGGQDKVTTFVNAQRWALNMQITAQKTELVKP